jgi:hypothetical protein
MTYTSGNPGPGFRQAQKCGGVKPVNGLPTLPFLIIGSPTAIQILTDINITKKTKKKKKKTCTDSLPLKKTSHYQKHE